MAAEGSTLRDVVVASLLSGNRNGVRTPLGTASILSSENVPIQGLGTNPYVMGHRVGATGRNQNIASQNAIMQLALNERAMESASASAAAKSQLEADTAIQELIAKGIRDPQERLEFTQGTRTEFPESRRMELIDAQPSSFGQSPTVREQTGYFDKETGQYVKTSRDVPEDEYLAAEATRQKEADDRIVANIQAANPGVEVTVQGDQVILTSRSTGTQQIIPRSQAEQIGN